MTDFTAEARTIGVDPDRYFFALAQTTRLRRTRGALCNLDEANTRDSQKRLPP